MKQEVGAMRAALTIVIGIVLALLLALAAAALLIPFVNSGNAHALRPISQAVFWIVFVAILALVIASVRRSRR